MWNKPIGTSPSIQRTGTSWACSGRGKCWWTWCCHLGYGQHHSCLQQWQMPYNGWCIAGEHRGWIIILTILSPLVPQVLGSVQRTCWSWKRSFRKQTYLYIYRSRERWGPSNTNWVPGDGAGHRGARDPPTPNKAPAIESLLLAWRGRKVCRKRELLALIGSLSHACKAVRAGWSFLRRLIDLSTTVKPLHRFVRLGASARSDIEWWYRYCSEWNGIAMMSSVNKGQPEFEVSIISDASGSWGCGAMNGREWFQLKWAGMGAISEQNITVKELLPIVLAAALWGSEWAGKTVRAQCDNSAVVAIVNSGTSREREAMHLLRCLAFLEAQHSFYMFASHIQGVLNTETDALSRDNRSLFHSLHPQAYRDPVAIPESLLDVLIVSRPDWTSQSWTQLWSSLSVIA